MAVTLQYQSSATYYTEWSSHFQAPRQRARSIKQSIAPVPSVPIGNPWAAAIQQTKTTLRLRGKDEPASPFLRLPAELRNQIYEYLLCPAAASLASLAARKMDTQVLGFNSKPQKTTTTLHPSLLSTCKQIHSEATPLLYSTPVFRAHPQLLTTLPHLVTPARPVLYPSVQRLIRRYHLTLRLDTDPLFTAAQAAAQFSGAEFLELHVWQAQFEACDEGVLALFTEIRGVGVARVGGTVEEKVARWLEGVMMREGEVEERCARCDEGQRCGLCRERDEFLGGGRWRGWVGAR